MPLSSFQKSQLAKQVASSGENIPIGGDPVLGEVLMTPALRQLVDEIGRLKDQMSVQANAIHTLNILNTKLQAELDSHRHTDFPMRLFQVDTQTNRSGTENGPRYEPFYWDKTSSRWWSVDVTVIQFGRNTTNYTGPLYLVNGINPAGGTGYYGNHMPYQSAFIGLSASCDENPVTGPASQQVDVYQGAASVYTVLWPDMTARFSSFLSPDEAIDLTPTSSTNGVYPSLAYKGSGVNTPIDRPRIDLYFQKYFTNDEHGGPGRIPLPESYPDV